MEFLTVQDSLYLLGRIRGVRSSHLSSMVSTISSLFLLDPFRKNYIHQLSGGTRRRLHAALALIGNSRKERKRRFDVSLQDLRRWLFSMNRRRVSIPLLENRCKRSSSMP